MTKQISDVLARQLALFLYLSERRDGARGRDILNDLSRHYGGEGIDEESVKRKMRRDISDLAELGFYIYFDNGLGAPAAHAGANGGEAGVPAACADEGRYMLDKERTYAAPVSFTDDEAAFLRVACASLLQDASYPRKTELLGALARLSDELEVPDTLLPLLDAGSPTSAPPSPLGKVRSALKKPSALVFSYTDARGASSRRTVAPLRIFTFNKHIYLVARDAGGEAGGEARAGEAGGERRCAGKRGATGENAGDADGLRVFRLDRMSSVKGGGKLPAGAFDMRGVDAWPCLPFQFSARRFPAKVCFSPAAYARASALTMQRGTFTIEGGMGEGGENAGAGETGSGEAGVREAGSSEAGEMCAREAGLSNADETSVHEADAAGAVWEIDACDAHALAAWCVENGPGLQPLAPPDAVQEFSRILDGVREALGGAEKEALGDPEKAPSAAEKAPGAAGEEACHEL